MGQAVNLFNGQRRVIGRHQDGVDQARVFVQPVLDRPVIEGGDKSAAAQSGSGKPATARKTGGPVSSAKSIFQRSSNSFCVKSSEKLKSRSLSCRVFDIGAGAAEGRVGVTAAGQVQPLIEQVLLIELGQVGQELLGVVNIVVDIAVDQLDAVGRFAGPAGRGDGRGAFLADVDLVDSFSGVCTMCCLRKIRSRT